ASQSVIADRVSPVGVASTVAFVGLTPRAWLTQEGEAGAAGFPRPRLHRFDHEGEPFLLLWGMEEVLPPDFLMGRQAACCSRRRGDASRTSPTRSLAPATASRTIAAVVAWASRTGAASADNACAPALPYSPSAR